MPTGNANIAKQYPISAAASERASESTAGPQPPSALDALRQSEARFRMLADNMSQLAWTCDFLGNVTWYNRRWLEYTGLSFEEMKGWDWSKVHHPGHLDRVVARVKHSAETGEPWEDTFPLRGKDGQFRWFLSRALPIRDEQGNIVQWFGTNTDVTDQILAEEQLAHANSDLARRVDELKKANLDVQDARRAALNLMEDAVQSRRAEETLNAALRDSERRFREMIDALPAAVYTTDAEGRITHFNPAAAEFSGHTPELGSDRWCVSWKLLHADGAPMAHDECPMAIALKEGRIIRGAEAVLERPDGTRRWFMPFPTPLRDAAGQVAGGINMLVDITERKQAEERQRLLTTEIAHRGRNLLAVVQTIVLRSLSGAHSLDEARDTLTQRIQALARSQSALLDGGEGAKLAEIVRLEFEGFSGRVEVSGPDLVLNRESTQAFALLVHELATNATKHGALSEPQGRVAIDWSIEGAGGDARFKFRWQERGGPPVTPPTRKGFGRTLIERVGAQHFGTQPQLEFDPEGLRCRIDAPLPAVAGA